MSPHHIRATLAYILAALCFTAASQAEPGTWDPGTWLSYIGDKKFESGFSRQIVVATPDWTPDQPLPFKPSEAIDLAKRELSRHTDDLSRWQTTEVAITRLHDAPTKWFYVVSLERDTTDPAANPGTSASVRIPVSFNRDVAPLVPQATPAKP